MLQLFSHAGSLRKHELRPLCNIVAGIDSSSQYCPYGIAILISVVQELGQVLAGEVEQASAFTCQPWHFSQLQFFYQGFEFNSSSLTKPVRALSSTSASSTSPVNKLFCASASHYFSNVNKPKWAVPSWSHPAHKRF